MWWVRWVVVTNLIAVAWGHLDAWRQAAFGQSDNAWAEVEAAVQGDAQDVVAVGMGLVIDRSTFTVWYRSKSYEMGNTMAFHLLERLARSPGVFFSIPQLIEDVWGGKDVSYEAVQRQVTTIRAMLKQAGMESAAGIGSVPLSSPATPSAR